MEKIKSNDRFGEALSHIKSGKEYKKCSDLYDSLETQEYSHNQRVSEFMKETEKRIRNSIAIDTEISLEEQKGFNLPAISSINLVETPPIPVRDYRNWVQRTYCGYDLSSIFNHFAKQSTKGEDRSLEIGTFQTSLGYFYPKLFRRGAPLEIIAISLPTTREGLEKLKDLIDNTPLDTINKVCEFVGNIEQMRNLLSLFQHNIEQIIHDEISFGLKGQCEKEFKLKFSYILFNRSLFRRRR